MKENAKAFWIIKLRELQNFYKETILRFAELTNQVRRTSSATCYVPHVKYNFNCSVKKVKKM